MIKMITKYVLIIILFFLPFVAFGLTVSPATLNCTDEYCGNLETPVPDLTPIIITCGNIDNDIRIFYPSTDGLDTNGSFSQEMCINGSTSFTYSSFASVSMLGTYRVLEIVPNTCDGLDTYPECVPYAIGVTGLITLSQQQSGGMDSLINTDKATFLATVGFSFDDLTTWSGDMIKMILGNGIGVLSNLMPWILAIMVFVGTLGLIWGGFRFFRH